jgi:hypothetical protein
MAWNTPGTATAGSVLTAAFLNTNLRDNMIELAPFAAAWTAYTPTAIGGGLTVGNGTFDAAYLKVGLFVVVRGRLTLGSTSTIGNSPGWTLPVTAATRILPFQSQFYDVSATTYYPASIQMQHTDRIIFDVINTAGTNAVAGLATATNPFTFATGDQLYFAGIYTSST